MKLAPVVVLGKPIVTPTSLPKPRSAVVSRGRLIAGAIIDLRDAAEKARRAASRLASAGEDAERTSALDKAVGLDGLADRLGREIGYQR